MRVAPVFCYKLEAFVDETSCSELAGNCDGQLGCRYGRKNRQRNRYTCWTVGLLLGEDEPVGEKNE